MDESTRPHHLRSMSDSHLTLYSEQKSIFEGKQVVVPTECFFPRPQEGQSLTSFLSSNEFNISAELDRENAHFCISEALIAAIEHMKCDQEIAKNCDVINDGSACSSALSVSPPASSSLCSNTEVVRQPEDCSAEKVALSLLSKFPEQQLPKASDLQWIVSEQEAPQELLPLPTGYPVPPQIIEEEFQTRKMRLRGNQDWAPPRPQIIFILLPEPKRKEVMERQKYRCAGCGMNIEKGKLSQFRYCHYFGKYFCQCCHRNELDVIPGRVLWRWDWRKRGVSRLAATLLEQLASDPLFDVRDLNPALYGRVSALDKCRRARVQLHHLSHFVKTCRHAAELQDMLKQQRSYIYAEPHNYSIQDLMQVRMGVLLRSLLPLVAACVTHVRDCQVCQAKGFVCEGCHKGPVIFSFQIDHFTQCTACGAGFHKHCAKSSPCPRCLRIQERRRKLADEDGQGVT